MEELLNDIEKETTLVLKELIENSNLKKGDLVVIGCSTSAVIGAEIGKNGSLQVGEAILKGVKKALKPKGIYFAAQCCEHLNRALVVERKLVNSMDIVSAVPHIRAGGAFATAVYKDMKDPVLVETISADAGIDIGGTLIGMHIKRVAVPMRLKAKNIGKAIVIAAYSRPKYIGGERAKYE